MYITTVRFLLISMFLGSGVCSASYDWKEHVPVCDGPNGSNWTYNWKDHVTICNGPNGSNCRKWENFTYDEIIKKTKEREGLFSDFDKEAGWGWKMNANICDSSTNNLKTWENFSEDEKAMKKSEYMSRGSISETIRQNFSKWKQFFICGGPNESNCNNWDALTTDEQDLIRTQYEQKKYEKFQKIGNSLLSEVLSAGFVLATGMLAIYGIYKATNYWQNKNKSFKLDDINQKSTIIKTLNFGQNQEKRTKKIVKSPPKITNAIPTKKLSSPVTPSSHKLNPLRSERSVNKKSTIHLSDHG